MSSLRGTDIQQILQLFENELGMLPKVNRTDKMRLRKKILNTLAPVLNSPGATSRAILQRVDSRLEDVLELFLDAELFRAKLISLLAEKLP